MKYDKVQGKSYQDCVAWNTQFLSTSCLVCDKSRDGKKLQMCQYIGDIFKAGSNLGVLN